MKTPKNGMYMTQADHVQFSESFGDMYSRYTGEKFTELNVKNVTVVVTEACNLACTYCYQHQKTPNMLSKEKAKEIVDFLLEGEKFNGYIDMEKSPCIIIDFIGGEPMLNTEVMDYFMDYFIVKAYEMNHPWAENYMISLSSNGLLYLSDEFQKFKRKHQGRISVGITIDGDKELHDSCRVFHDGSGSYDDVIVNVKQWIKDYPDTSTKVTLAPENLDHMVRSIFHLWGLGLFSVPANVVYEDVWSKEDATKFYYKLKELADRMLDEEVYKYKYTSLFRDAIGKPQAPDDDQNYCGGTGAMLAFGPDGRMYPCLRYMKYSLGTPDRKELSIGNIKTGIDTTSDPLLVELDTITRSSQSTEKCFNCPISTGCSWCSAFNYDVFGTANKRATFHCDMHKAQVLGNVYYWNKLYKKLSILDTFEMNVPKEWALEIIPEEEYEMLLALTK